MVNGTVGHIRQRVFQIIEKARDASDRASRFFDLAIVLLIVLNIFAVILSSFSQVSRKYAKYLDIFEVLSVGIFTVEYAMRLWTAKLKYPQLHYYLAIPRYIVSFAAIIDLAAILPFYLPLVAALDLRFLRILRVTRILRVFKLQRYSESLNFIGRALQRRSRELLITIFVTLLLLLVSASAMYYLENGAQPNQFPNIIASLWWAVATLTTVGYGDVYPLTVGGKLLGGIIAILGIGLVALPAGILSSGFLEEMQSRKTKPKPIIQVCPHCGKRIRIASDVK